MRPIGDQKDQSETGGRVHYASRRRREVINAISPVHPFLLASLGFGHDNAQKNDADLQFFVAPCTPKGDHMLVERTHYDQYRRSE
jgi:hypothetical protein